MKKLIVSIKSSNEALSDFKKSLKKSRKGNLKGDHYEISFDSRKDFDRFIKSLSILSAILTYKPKSVYELAKHLDMDVSNLNKIILFLETVGAISIKTSTVSGRTVKTPVVSYDQVEFALRAS